jgi:hypothetical protein
VNWIDLESALFGVDMSATTLAKDATVIILSMLIGLPVVYSNCDDR